MSKRSLRFFATKGDVAPLLQALESSHSLVFARAGLFDSSEVQVMSSIVDKNLGISKHGNSNLDVKYLVAAKGSTFHTRRVQQHSGCIKYAIDQRNNPQSILFQPGGVYNDGCLIGGELGAVSSDEDSVRIFRLFHDQISSRFSKVGSFWVGSEALGLLDKGWRLTMDVNSPESYDLKTVV